MESSVSSVDRGSFLELNLASEEAYMFTTDCVNVYICKTHRKDSNFFGFDIFSWDVVTDCYQRDKKVDDEFHNAAMKNPDDCNVKGYIKINSAKCYFNSSGKDVSFNSKVSHGRVRYYDSEPENVF